MSKLAHAMWRQAMHDRAQADRLLEGEAFDWAALASQQAAEKALKAVLLMAGLRADATHNLGGMFDALVAEGIMDRSDRAALNDDLSFLTLAFGFARYPSAVTEQAPADLVTRTQAETAIAGADAIIAVARRVAPEFGA